MKKLLLVILSGCVLPAFAQHTGKKLQPVQEMQTRVKGTMQEMNAGQKKSAFNFSHLAKTTAAPFETDDFSSGSPNSLPTGWSAGSVLGNGTWQWTSVSATGQYNIGAINSTTASNGWMIYDSDTIGLNTGNATVLEGWLQSPSYNCSGHATVQVSFEEHFRNFNDSCYVQVSTNGGASFTNFSVAANNALSSTSFLPSNPYNARVNISSVAANQANVIIRFLYKYDGPAGGGYNWLIDDFALSELDPVEFAADQAGVVMIDGTGGFTSFGAIPTQFIDTLFPVVAISNNGSTTPNATVTSEIFRGTTSVYNESVTLTSLATGTVDSIVDFPDYVTNSVGNYTAAFSVSSTGDVDNSNNIDTSYFDVTDSVYHRIGQFLRSSYYIHRPSSNANGESAASIGTFFTVPVGKSDTLKAVSVAFDDATSPGSELIVRIYKLVSSGTSGQYDEIASTIQKPLTAAEISTTTQIRYAYFPMDPSFGSFIMDEGDYAVVVMGNNVAANNTVLLMTSDLTTPPALNYLHGVYDTSLNDGVTGFGGASNLPFRIDASPLVRLHMQQGPLSVNDVNNIQIVGDVFPNPANSSVSMAFSLKQASEVNVSVVNTLGQVVKSTSVGVVNANQRKEVAISTSDLAPGVYMYTIEANGQRTTNRFVVAH